METSSRFDVDEAPGAPAPGASAADSAAEQARTIGLQLKELQAYIRHYFVAKADAMKLSARNAMLYTAIGIVLLFSAIAFLATSVVLLCIGIADGLGALLGGRYWLGQIIVGVVVLAGTALAIRIGIGKITRTSKGITVGKYEQREREQRRQYGHDVHQRASQSDSQS